ncbi:MAG: 50S ribosomal protein L11 methyltransferase [Gemmatimonadaceae bacterium]
MSWTALRITPDANRDGVIAALFASGSRGILEDGAALVTHFPPDAAVDAIRSAVLDADPRATLSITAAPAVDYSSWRASVSAHRIGGLVITPPWLAAEFDSATTIVVDPVMAFGTGEHATTRSVVRLMQGVIRPGDVVADLGAGSAVLSIAAVRLGAARVAAIELDQDAIGNAEENVRANDVADRVEVIEGDAGTLLPLLAPVRVVLANIISSVLIPLLPTLRASLTADGQAILSGILHEERDEVVAALHAGNWLIEREDTEDVWWSVQITRR